MKTSRLKTGWVKKAYAVFIPVSVLLAAALVVLALKEADRERLAWEKSLETELKTTAALAADRIDSSITEVENFVAARAEIPGPQGPQPGESASTQIFAEVRDRILDIFIVRKNGLIRSLLFKPVFLTSAELSGVDLLSNPRSDLFSGAERFEYRDGDFAAAARAYEELLLAAQEGYFRARLLNRAARCYRKLGRTDAAIALYRRIVRDHPAELSEDGLPLGCLARLGIASALEDQRDRAGAGRAYLDLLSAILAGDWTLSKAQVDYFQALLDRRIADILPTLPGSEADSLKAAFGLKRKELDQRITQTQWLEIERDQLVPALLAQRAKAIPAAAGFVRGSRAVDGKLCFAAVRQLRSGDTLGILFNLKALSERALEWATSNPAVSHNIVMDISDESGAPLARTPGPDIHTGRFLSTVTQLIPDASLPLRIRAAYADPGKLAAGFERRRVLYAIVAVLAASALFFGGLMGLRGISRQMELAGLKSDFVSMVSHELRTPLTSIQYLIELLETGKIKDEAKVQTYYKTLGRESRLLGRLVDDVLDLSRMEAGRSADHFDLADPAALTVSVLDGFRAPASQRGIQLIAEIDGPVPRAVFDPEAVGRALSNLLDNALKYSSPNEQVSVRLSGDERDVVWQVADTGMGISPDEAAHVFDRFYRSPRVAQGEIRGSGLGLAIVKQIAERHGGAVAVDSAPGQGTTVTLRIPRNRHAKNPDR